MVCRCGTVPEGGAGGAGGERQHAAYRAARHSEVCLKPWEGKRLLRWSSLHRSSAAKSAVGSAAGLEIETGVAAGIGLLLVWWYARHRRRSCGTAAMGCCCMNPDGAHVGGGESNTSGNSLLGKPPTDLVFKAVLADERATQEFLAFTQAEFSSENLEFYLARPCGHT